tara:strand:+ start:1003 stop:1932 length:930 start_codon:yes stop_codon:yes gene_type:complete
MQTVAECYKKVHKDCFKFIRSQEIKKDKFINKAKMVKYFLIPICFWIAKKAKNRKPFIVGLSGGQGTGKTTISSIMSIILKKYFKLNIFKISIDDFYKTRKERFLLSKKIHNLLKTRGVPGTHDTSIILDFLNKVKHKNFKPLKLPKFNKATDDRFKKELWYSINKRPDVIIFEGWCIGARPQKNYQLKKHINSVEKLNDQNLIWRKYVNYQLKKNYRKLFNQLNCLLYLKAKNFNLLQKWRLKQERKLLTFSKEYKNLKIMNKKEVINFMKTYERITENMFKDAPKYASIILNLNSNHQIKSVFYKKK